jgi:Pvc16 N-terminal domain
VSSALALGAVSAVLRNLLDNGLIDVSSVLGPVTVSAVAPDRIDTDAPNAAPQINLFLHQVLPNAAWSNRQLPTRSSLGDRVANTPLALDLHYLVTAYGVADLQAEILLGYAMHLLHERPLLDRAAIRRALDPSPLDVSLLPPAFQVLAAADLADQIEAVRVTPVPMSVDEMSKIWSSTQKPYRPSAAYQVSLVLIEGTRPARSALPVLSRGPVDPLTLRDRGVSVQPDLLAPGPALRSIALPNRQSAARAGDALVLAGARLEGMVPRLRLRHRLLAVPLELPLVLAPGGREASCTLPAPVAAHATLPAGLWQASVVLTPPAESSERESNSLALAVAPDPVIAADPTLVLAGIDLQRLAGPPRLRVRLFVRPQVRPEQAAQLALGNVTAIAARRTDAAEVLEFEFPGALAAGPAWLRLRVDGVDSLLVDKVAVPPRFDPAYQVTVPA